MIDLVFSSILGHCIVNFPTSNLIENRFFPMHIVTVQVFYLVEFMVIFIHLYMSSIMIFFNCILTLLTSSLVLLINFVGGGDCEK